MRSDMSFFRFLVTWCLSNTRKRHHYPLQKKEYVRANFIYRAQYYLPAAEIFWGMFTLGTAFVKNYEQLVVMRFFVGLSATSCYVGLVHVVNS